MSALCYQYSLEINDTEFLSGVENWKTDDLSTIIEKKTTIEAVMVSIGMGDKPIIDIGDDQAVSRLIRACQPKAGIDSEDEFISL
jgi:hypothetical protein